jgi:hypothetical protein
MLPKAPAEDYVKNMKILSFLQSNNVQVKPAESHLAVVTPTGLTVFSCRWFQPGLVAGQRFR